MTHRVHGKAARPDNSATTPRRLRQVNRHPVAGFDVVDFLQTVTETTVKLLSAGAAGLMLADQRAALHVMASTSQEALKLELFELEHVEAPCVDCYNQGQAVVNIDPDEAEARWPIFGKAVRATQFTSVHAIPLRLRDEVIGAMNIFLARPGILTEQDPALGQAIADIATISLLQDRALQEKQLPAEQLQGALNSRGHHRTGQGHARRTPRPAHGYRVQHAPHPRPQHEPDVLSISRQVIDGTLDTSQLAHRGSGTN